MTDKWADIHSITVGSHIHLDKVVESPPAPGSVGWLPIIEDMLGHLVNWGGHWTVTMPIGFVTRPPDGRLSTEELFRLTDKSSLLEPPAVYRLADELIANRGEGECHGWMRLVQPNVRELITFSRSREEIAAGEEFNGQVSFEVRSR
jgi:hypothetical protein